MHLRLLRQNRDMTQYAKNCKATIIPGLRYRDAPAMIEWLGRAFGFETKAMYPGPGNTVMHAELTFGNGMIMVGSVDNGTPSSALKQQPDELEGKRKHRVPISSFRIAMPFMQPPKRPAPRSCLTWRTRATVAKALRAAIPRVTSGTSEPTIRGNSCRSREKARD